MASLTLPENFMCKLNCLLMCIQFINCSKTSAVMSENLSFCTLMPVSRKLVGKLNKLITSDNRLIALDVTIEWNKPAPDEMYPSHKKWFITTSASGQRLLLLPDRFSEMSLGTLSYSFAHLQVKLQQAPEDCLEYLSANDSDNLLMNFFLTLPNNSIRHEDGTSNLHICNGSIKFDGYCCNLSLTGNNLTCSALKESPWVKPVQFIFGILTSIFLLQSISFIPKDIYEESNTETFTLSDTTINMQLKVTDHFTPSDKNGWNKIALSSDNFLIRFREKLNGLLAQSKLGNNSKETLNIYLKVKAIIADKSQLHSETSSYSGVLDFMYSSCKDILRLCICSGGCFWSRFDKMVLLLLIILIFVPFVLRVLFLFKYESLYEYESVLVSFMTLILYLGSALLFMKCVIKIKCVKEKVNIDWKKVIKKSLCVTFETESTATNKYNGYTASSVIDLIIHAKSYFPLLQFLFLVSSYVWKRSSFAFSLWSFVALSGIIAVFYLVVDCVLFYVKCFFCIMLGLLLNYKKVFQYVLLFFVIVRFSYNSIKDCQNITSKLTARIFKVIRELNKHSQNIQPNSIILIQGNEDRERHTLSRFVSCNCDTVCWLPRGLTVFYVLSQPENLYFMHVSNNFIDYISALPGRLTPGSRYSLLLSSFKEIFSAMVILFLVLYFVSGFGQVNDLSSSVLTIVTLVSGTVSSVLARLWFKPKEFPDVNNDLHLNQLIKARLYNYEEPWIIEDFDILSFERNYETGVKEDDNDLVVETLGTKEEVWYVKPLVKGNGFDSMAAEKQLKRMFISDF